jgi:hypothetical protein
MSYAFVQDIPATWGSYQEVADALEACAPDGLLLHVAGPTDEGFRMIGVWDSREPWDRFRDDRLGAILEKIAGGSRLRPTIRELNVAHLLSGTAVRRAPD